MVKGQRLVVIDRWVALICSTGFGHNTTICTTLAHKIHQSRNQWHTENLSKHLVCEFNDYSSCSWSLNFSIIWDYSRNIIWAVIVTDRKGWRPSSCWRQEKCSWGFVGHCKPPSGSGAEPWLGPRGSKSPRSSGVLCINSTQFGLKTVLKSTFN